MIQVPFEDGCVSREQLAAAIAALPAPSQARVPRPPRAHLLPSISVVVPSLLERLDGLQACLRSLADLDYPDYEVIVVDNRPAGSPPVDLPGVRVVRETRPGISAARNRGLEDATGEIVAFTDDDVEVDPGWLRAIATRFLAQPEEACVTGLTLPNELETPAQVALEEYYGGFGVRTFAAVSHRMRAPRGSSLLAPATVDAIDDSGRVLRSFSLYAAGSFGAGANMAYRAAALRELGGFDCALGAGTDTHGGEDLAMFARLVWRGHARRVRAGFDRPSHAPSRGGIARAPDQGLRRRLRRTADGTCARGSPPSGADGRHCPQGRAGHERRLSRQARRE